MRLEFETTSNDRRGRMISPINVTTYNSNGSIDFNSVLNAQKEWFWKYI